MSNNKFKILIVEDEPTICSFIYTLLDTNGYKTYVAPTCELGKSIFTSYLPDLIILDLGLPDRDGRELIHYVRQKFMTPIIVLSARTTEADKIEALDLGANDYITKPFSPKELTARLHAVMRRVSPTSVDEVIEVQGLKLDPVSHRVSAEEKALDMGPTEFKLLHFFMTHPERVYSREQLLNNVWGTNVHVEDRTVDVHIRRLRKAIEETGHDRLIQTVRGAGYRFSTRL
jgi:two-component system phosphate regulon response regulator PhoB